MTDKARLQKKKSSYNIDIWSKMIIYIHSYARSILLANRFKNDYRIKLQLD